MFGFKRAARPGVLAVLLVVYLAASALAADLYQVSTIEALSAGLYGGQASFADLARHGDFGLGTFASLDGEMVALGGVFYQVKSDGTVRTVAASEKTPFAAVVFFKGALDLGQVDNLAFSDCKAALEARLPDPSRFYAVRVDGSFPSLTLRSVPAQKEPWPDLAEAIKGQTVFPLQNVQGTMVGFYAPPGVPQLAPPGWHFHFLSADRVHGGHVLDAALGQAKARADAVDAVTVIFPDKPVSRRQIAAPAAGTE